MDAGLPDEAARRLPATTKYELRVVLAIVAVVLVGIPFGWLLHQVTTDGPLTALDESVAQWTNRRIRDQAGLISLMKAISLLGKPVVLAVIVGIPALWLVWRGAHKLAVFLAVTGIGGGIVDTLVKIAVGRPRPKVDEPIVEAFGRSFPSGHSMSSLVCYGALLIVFGPVLSPAMRRVATAVAAVVILAVGLSRLVLGVHFVSDVAGGYVLGAAWLAASVAAFETWRADRGRPTTHPLSEGVEPEEADELVAT